MATEFRCWSSYTCYAKNKKLVMGPGYFLVIVNSVPSSGMGFKVAGPKLRALIFETVTLESNHLPI
jgi:hypothetical protein